MDMGMNYYLVKNRPSIDNGLYIGKSSFGWRFIFYKTSTRDSNKSLHTFEQWRDYLKETTETGTHVIMNEYEEIVLYNQLMKLIANKQEEDNPDMLNYYENVNGYLFFDKEFVEMSKTH